MDQTLDQVVKSRKIGYLGKVMGAKKQQGRNQQQRGTMQRGGGGFKNNKRFGQQGGQFKQPQRGFTGRGGGVQKKTNFMRQNNRNMGGGGFQQMRQMQQQFRGGFQQVKRQQFVLQQQPRQFNRRNITRQNVMNTATSFGGQIRSYGNAPMQQTSRTNQQTTTKLYISNLDFGVTNQDIKELFGEFGPIVRYGVNFSAGGRSVGSAEVVYRNQISAVKAMQKYNGVTLDGRVMKLEVSGGSQPQNQQQQYQNSPRQQQRFVQQPRQQQPRMLQRQRNMTQKMMPKNAIMMKQQSGVMRTRNVMQNQRNQKGVIANAAIKRAKNILRMAAIQKKTGGVGKSKKPLTMKGGFKKQQQGMAGGMNKGNKKQVPNVNQLDADLEAYNLGKD